MSSDPLLHPSQQPFAWFADRTAVLATMHRKEQVIAPVLEQELRLQILVPPGFDTDRFGTFSREIARTGSQVEAARAKAHQAMDLTEQSLGLASEGAFGPHPTIPYLPCNRELIVLVDRQHQFEVVGEAISTDTNYSQIWASSLEEAQRFAQQIGFPDHGLVVIAGAEPQQTAGRGSRPTAPAPIAPDQITPDRITKGITSEAHLAETVEAALRLGPVWLETDMRALYNPKRMRVIEQATKNLVQKIRQVCPSCGAPGFDLVERRTGLPCGWCHGPTSLIRAVIYRCPSCGFNQETEFPEGTSTADPTYCPFCNP
jgi:hypothetical protein